MELKSKQMGIITATEVIGSAAVREGILKDGWFIGMERQTGSIFIQNRDGRKLYATPNFYADGWCSIETPKGETLLKFKVISLGMYKDALILAGKYYTGETV